MPAAPGNEGEALRSVWLECGPLTVEVGATPVLIGRAEGCHVLLDDAKVSRRHAQVYLSHGDLVLEDLGSVNGVHFGGARISGPVALRVGDRFTIGNAEFVVQPADFRASPRAAGTKRLGAETVNAMSAPVLETMAAEAPEVSVSSLPTHTLELLGGVADKMLARGLPEEAERVLGAFLNNVLVAARERRTLDPGVVDKASYFSLRLAAATGRGAWSDWVLSLHLALGRLLPGPQVEQLYQVQRAAPPSLGVLREYLAQQQATVDRLSPSERFSLQRLMGLERALAAR